jgi:ComF family protein
MLSRLNNTIKQLLFPNICMLCAKDYASSNINPFCFSCTVNMPYTNHFKTKPNNATPKFRERVPCVDVACLLNFYSYSDVKTMLHRLKYKGRKDIGFQLGLMSGQRAKNSLFFDDIDLIVPIPIHKSKLIKRGYNQASFIAKGVSEKLKVPVREDVIIKHTNTRSQTKMNRIERVKNVRSSFQLVDKQGIQGRHILLVDDVLTTGATIEACANHLLESSDVKLSILCMCLARN